MSFQFGSLWMWVVLLSWMISWNQLLTYLRNCSDLRARDKREENINGKRNATALHRERHLLAVIDSLPPTPKAGDCLICGGPIAARPGGPRNAAGSSLQSSSIYIPSQCTWFLQILQLHCRQINAVICFQQGGGNPLWHFLFLNNWSCFVFPKPYWSKG